MDEDIPLNRIEWRTPDGTKSEDFHTLTNEELPSNERLLDTRLYIIIGPWTFSAGEEFANNMKVNKRATIVGEPTGGGANPCRMHDINDLFETQAMEIERKIRQFPFTYIAPQNQLLL